MADMDLEGCLMLNHEQKGDSDHAKSEPPFYFWLFFYSFSYLPLTLLLIDSPLFAYKLLSSLRFTNSFK